ncbi:unnamed protein product [Adineta ricciae]|uniref:Uncharacterized protein n=1 Tax=Adineta ricciae TaxID=249248 RepID=A0A813XH43_ADIRI|nr:unnamed protein product [Adineta ricciae]
MGCFSSRELIDFSLIQPTILQSQNAYIEFSGSTERGRFQALGHAEMALTEDCLYSQVRKSGCTCCCDQGVLRVPVLAIIDIQQKSYFNKRYRAEYPHMVITYVIRDEHGRKEHQAAWQMSNVTYKKWKNAIKQVQGRYPPSEFG